MAVTRLTRGGEAEKSSGFSSSEALSLSFSAASGFSEEAARVSSLHRRGSIRPKQSRHQASKFSFLGYNHRNMKATANWAILAMETPISAISQKLDLRIIIFSEHFVFCQNIPVLRLASIAAFCSLPCVWKFSENRNRNVDIVGTLHVMERVPFWSLNQNVRRQTALHVLFM